MPTYQMLVLSMKLAQVFAQLWVVFMKVAEGFPKERHFLQGGFRCPFDCCMQEHPKRKLLVHTIVPSSCQEMFLENEVVMHNALPSLFSIPLAAFVSFAATSDSSSPLTSPSTSPCMPWPPSHGGWFACHW